LSRKARPLPETKYLRQILEYDQATGIFVWKLCRGKVGKMAGCNLKILHDKRATPLQYRQIKIAGIRYLAHRLAWAYVHGECPEHLCIDHINGDGLDNRVTNLRLCTHSQNMSYKKITPRYGVPGVEFKGYKFHVGKRTRLGSFMNIEDAAKARLAFQMNA
jgi:HNH endonuclease